MARTRRTTPCPFLMMGGRSRGTHDFDHDGDADIL